MHDAVRVVFVCTHNSARSQLAAALWNGTSPIPATSAGTHPAPAVHPGAIAAARRHCVPLAPFPRGTSTTSSAADDADLVITVCDAAHEELALPDTNPGRLHWSVPDPARTGEDAAFDRVVTDLTGRIARVAPAVRPTDRRPDTGGPDAG